MSAFHPITPLKAVEFVEAAGVSGGRRLIADFTAAGLIKSYAVSIETVPVGGASTCVRDSAISPQLWQRIVRDGVVHGAILKAVPARNAKAPAPEDDEPLVVPARGTRSAKPDPSAIPPGALLISISKTEQVLDVCRSTVNNMIRDKRLSAKKVGRSTKIEVDSIYALLGIAN